MRTRKRSLVFFCLPFLMFLLSLREIPTHFYTRRKKGKEKAEIELFLSVKLLLDRIELFLQLFNSTLQKRIFFLQSLYFWSQSLDIDTWRQTEGKEKKRESIILSFILYFPWLIFMLYLLIERRRVSLVFSRFLSLLYSDLYRCACTGWRSKADVGYLLWNRERRMNESSCVCVGCLSERAISRDVRLHEFPSNFM